MTSDDHPTRCPNRHIAIKSLAMVTYPYPNSKAPMCCAQCGGDLFYKTDCGIYFRCVRCDHGHIPEQYR